MGDYAAALARFWNEHGAPVCILTEPQRGPRPRDIQVIEVPLRGWRDLRRVLLAIVTAAPARVQLEYSQYGWHRWGCPFWLNALFLALRLRGIRLCLALHEFPIHFSQHPGRFAFAALQRIHFWFLCLASGEVHANTRERVEVLQRWFPWRKQSLFYRPNSNVNPVFPCTREDRANLRRKQGVGHGEIVVGVYGLFSEAKNLEAAIQAVGSLQATIPLHLWLLGDPSQARPQHMAKLLRHANQFEGRTYWSGSLSPQDVSLHFQSVDIFLLPQKDGHLTRSGTFMAAAEHGLPVIAVENAPNQREFAHGQDVWIVAEGTASRLAEAIRILTGDETLRLKLGSNLRKLYAQRFDWPVVQPVVIPEKTPETGQEAALHLANR